jgi:hypothetical protein
MNKQMVHLLNSLFVALVLMLLTACVTTSLPVEEPPKAVSFSDGVESLVPAKLGKVRIKPLIQFEKYKIRKSWMKNIEEGFKNKLKAMLGLSNLFDNTEKDAINVTVEILSWKRNTATFLTDVVDITIKYEFSAEDGTLLLTEEITSNGSDSSWGAIREYMTVLATHKAISDSISKLSKRVKEELPASWHAYAQKQEAIYRRIAAELGKEDGYYRVVTTQAVVRGMPDADAIGVSKLSQEELVHVTGSLPSGWLQVSREGKPIGWVHSSLLREDFASLPSYRPVDAQKVTLAPAPTHAAQANVTAAALDFGTYHALVIGNNEYHDIQKLRTAVNDARAVAALLQDKYGFKARLVLNATRADIMRAINGYRRRLGPRDNLLIYYAGHGWLDKDADQGYWLPVDATEHDPTNWISNGSITDSLRAMEAKHVLVIADSCYSGKLARGINVRIRTKNYYEKISRKKARTVMASGGLEPVADEGGKGTHSVFASALIEALNENQGVLDATLLFSQIRRPVMVNTDQTPEYSDIRKAGHEGGDFLFVKQKR